MKAKPFLPVAVLCAAAFALMSGAAPAARASVPAPYPPAFPARVVELMDGDSFKVTCEAGTVEVRLFDVNCPEFDEPGGERAKSITRQATLGRRAWIFPSGKRPKDAHGRLLARVWTPKGWLSDVLLRMGAAQRYADPDKPSAGPVAKLKGQAPSRPQDPSAEPSGTKAEPGTQSSPLVYITKTGSKYHRAECPHLRHGSIAIPLAEATDRGLEPCAHCQPPQ